MKSSSGGPLVHTAGVHVGRSIWLKISVGFLIFLVVFAEKVANDSIIGNI